MSIGIITLHGFLAIFASTESAGVAWATVLLTLIGFLVAFAVGIFCEPISRRLFSAKLKLKFYDDEESGCRARTPGETKSGHSLELCYVRVKVTNSSLTRRIAKNCVPYLVRLEKTGIDGEDPERFQDSIPLLWSYRDEKEDKAIDIPDGLSAFFDVLYTRSDNDQFYWCFSAKEPKRYLPLRNQKDDFIFTILVAAENTAPEKIKLTFKWRGDWKNFEACAENL